MHNASSTDQCSWSTVTQAFLCSSTECYINSSMRLWSPGDCRSFLLQLQCMKSNTAKENSSITAIKLSTVHINVACITSFHGFFLPSTLGEIYSPLNIFVRLELEIAEDRWCRGGSGIQKQHSVSVRDEQWDAAILEGRGKKVSGGKRTGAESDCAVWTADWQFQDIASIKVWETYRERERLEAG